MIVEQFTLDPEDIAQLYLNAYNEGQIDDNPTCCFRWLFETCKHGHRCKKSKPCDDFTMREDEALEEA